MRDGRVYSAFSFYQQTFLTITFIGIFSLQILSQNITATIDGPDTVSWNSSNKYTLIIEENGLKKPILTEVIWSTDKKISIPSTKFYFQTVKTAQNQGGDFNKETFTLTARTILQRPRGDVVLTAKKTITISDAAKKCEEIDAEIQKLLNYQGDLEGKINDHKAEIVFIKVPKLTSEEDFEILNKDLADKRAKLNEIADAHALISEEIKTSRATKSELESLRHQLWQMTPDLARLTYANDRYKKSGKTKTDKLDFIWAVFGKNSEGVAKPSDSLSKIDVEVDIAKERVRTGLAPVVSASVVEFAKLAKTAVSLSSKVSLSKLGKLAFAMGLSRYVKNELEIESAVKTSEYTTNQQNELEKLAARFPTQLNSLAESINSEVEILKKTNNKRLVDRSRARLKIKLAETHDSVIDIINSLPPENIHRTVLNNAASSRNKLDQEVAKLESEIKNLRSKNTELEKKNRLAISERNQIQMFKIDPAVRELEALKKKIASLKLRRSENCLEENNVAKASFDVSKTDLDQILWVDWKSAAVGSPGKAIGTVKVSDGDVKVTYNGEISFAQTGAGTGYWAPNEAYISSSVNNPPDKSDLIALDGTSKLRNTIVFSKPVKNPVMAIVSLGRTDYPVTYSFNRSSRILSVGNGYWGNGTLSSVGRGIKGMEGHGVIQFDGEITSISWTVDGEENWHGFTIGVPNQ